jgi:hypothetical protein
MGEEYKIDRIRRACAGCQREFKSGDTVVSAVAQVDEALVRQDFCKACWPKHAQDVFGSWERPFPYHEKPKLEDMDKVQKFFDRILRKPEPSPALEGVKFFTGLVLLRKKRVKLLGTRTEGETSWLRLEKAWDGEVVEVQDPGITEEKLAEIRQNMEQLFEMELNAGPEDAAGPAAPISTPPATA